MYDKGAAASLRTLLNICRDNVPIVATFILLFVLSFVATMVKFATTFSISCLSQFFIFFFAAFLSDFFFVSLISCKTQIWVKNP